MATLDQSYTTGQDNADGSGIGNLRRAANNNEILVQSFTPTQSGVIPQFEIYMKKVGSPTGNIWAEIWSDAGGPGTGSQINGDSATVDVSTVAGAYGYQMFTWSSNYPMIAAGLVYWVRLYGDYTMTADVGVYVGIDTSSPSYTGGNYGRYGDGGANWENTPSYDMLFKQYYNPGSSGPFIAFEI